MALTRQGRVEEAESWFGRALKAWESIDSPAVQAQSVSDQDSHVMPPWLYPVWLQLLAVPAGYEGRVGG